MPTLLPVSLLVGALGDKRIMSQINRRLYVLVYTAAAMRVRVRVHVRIIGRKQTAKVKS